MDVRKIAEEAEKRLREEKIQAVGRAVASAEAQAADRVYARVRTAQDALPGILREAASKGSRSVVVVRVSCETYDLREALAGELRRGDYPMVRQLGPLNFGQIHGFLAELGIVKIAPRPALKWVAALHEDLTRRRKIQVPELLQPLLDACKRAGVRGELFAFDYVGESGVAVVASW